MTGDAPDGRVEVVVLTYNRPVELRRTLERLTTMPERPRVRVIDNASSDSSAEEVCRDFAGVRFLRLDRTLGAEARNLGVREAASPYVAFCDDDMWWEEGSLCRAADLLDANPDVALLNARILVGGEGRLDPVCAEMETSPLPDAAPGPGLLGFLAGAAVVRRHAFLAAGGFDRHFFIGGEEELLALDLRSAGWKLAYAPQLVLRHEPSDVRDPTSRGRIQLRNALWVSWLRRPWKKALRDTAKLVRLAWRENSARAALLDGVVHGAWILTRRRQVSPEVEREILLLERARNLGG